MHFLENFTIFNSFHAEAHASLKREKDQLKFCIPMTSNKTMKNIKNTEEKETYLHHVFKELILDKSRGCNNDSLHHLKV